MAQTKTKIKQDDLNTALRLRLFKELNGKAFCMTGTLSVSRQQLEGIITFLGGVNHAAIKSTTTALICPNGSDFRKGSKYKTALTQGIMIITEQEFCDLILPSIDELRGNTNEGRTN
jgi:NAD-dependent DNA ligase